MSQRTIACVGKMLVCYASQSKKTESSYRHWVLDWGSAFRKKEVRLKLLHDDNERWEQLRAEMRSTQKLYDRVRRLGLGLSMPQPEQVLRLSDLPLNAKELKQSKIGEYQTVNNTPRRELAR